MDTGAIRQEFLNLHDGSAATEKYVEIPSVAADCRDTLTAS